MVSHTIFVWFVEYAGRHRSRDRSVSVDYVPRHARKED